MLDSFSAVVYSISEVVITSSDSKQIISSSGAIYLFIIKLLFTFYSCNVNTDRSSVRASFISVFNCYIKNYPKAYSPFSSVSYGIYSPSGRESAFSR